jgi:hypothetical protein
MGIAPSTGGAFGLTAVGGFNSSCVIESETAFLLEHALTKNATVNTVIRMYRERIIVYLCIRKSLITMKLSTAK